MDIYQDFISAANIVDLTIRLLQQRQGDQAGEPTEPQHDGTVANEAVTIDAIEHQIQAIIDSIGKSEPIQYLKKVLSLNQQQTALLLLAVLPYQQVYYRQRYGLLNGDSQQDYPTLNLLTNLVTFSWTSQQQLIQQLLNNDPLLFWRFLVIADEQQDVLGSQVKVPVDVLYFLIGISDINTDCHHCLCCIPKPSHSIVPMATINDLKQTLTSQPDEHQLIGLQGEAGVGRKTQALYLSDTAQLFQFKTERFAQYEEPIAVLKDCLRLLLLLHANLYLSCSLQQLHQYPGVSAVLAKWLALQKGRLFFAEPSNQPTQPSDTANSASELSSWPGVLMPFHPKMVSLSQLSIQESQTLWQVFIQHYLPQFQHLPNIDWPAVSSHYPLSPRLMLQVCMMIYHGYATHAVFTLSEVLALCRAVMKAALANLAVHCSPKDTLPHLVLTPETREQLQEIILYSRHSPLLNKLGIRDTKGIQALFWGPSGTGKTMAAGVVSNELQRPLYKADLSNIASKWIGETEKHLAQLFDQAERNNGVLFFDEADAVFGKRSAIESSHDKHANMGVSYLLQRMEAFQGTLILATNFKGNVDTAFLRRLQLSVEFPMPGPDERLALWQQVWSRHLKVHPQLDLSGLAKQFELSGANIKNISIYASVMAIHQQQAYIQAQHIAKGIIREYQKLDNNYRIHQQVNQWLTGVSQ